MTEQTRQNTGVVLMLDAALMGDRPDLELQYLQEDSFFKDHIPEVQSMVGFGDGSVMKDLWQHTKQVVRQTVPQPHLRWASLFHDVGKPSCFYMQGGKVSFHMHEAKGARIFRTVASRLGIKPEVFMPIAGLIHQLGLVEAYESNWTDSAVRRLTRETGDRLPDLLNLSRADITTKHDSKRKAHHEKIHELQERAQKLTETDAIPPALPTNLGLAIMEHFAIPEGPEVGRFMKTLRDLVEAGKLPRNEPSFEVYLQALGD